MTTNVIVKVPADNHADVRVQVKGDGWNMESRIVRRGTEEMFYVYGTGRMLHIEEYEEKED